jgi:hypothetical protein
MVRRRWKPTEAQIREMAKKAGRPVDEFRRSIEAYQRAEERRAEERATKRRAKKAGAHLKR